jgi:hypothetical protein
VEAVQRLEAQVPHVTIMLSANDRTHVVTIPLKLGIINAWRVN